MKHSVLNKIVLIGASTGGPGQIEKIINSLPPLKDASIIIAQHMVDGFIPSFASRLKEHSVNPVNMSKDKTVIESANIYLCDGISSVKKDSLQLIFSVKAAEAHKYNPDINNLFNSFVPLVKDLEILTVILTGIGDDGVDGCKQLSLRGARAITESEESAIVDGMPCRARKEVPDIEISDMTGIVNKIKDFCS